MAFPQVPTETGGAQAADTTSHTVNLPASIASGDLLLVFFSVDGSPTLTWPAGWESLIYNGATFSINVRYKIADGSEGASITVTSSASEKSAHLSYRVTGWHGTTVPEQPGQSSSASANPDPPALTPSWGSEDTLWFAATAVANADRTFSADPANYLNGAGQSSGSSTTGAIVRSARRELAAASEDPGTFTLDASSTWIAVTVAVRPAAAGGGEVLPIPTNLNIVLMPGTPG